MTTADHELDARLIDALSDARSSTRLRAALMAGTHPGARLVAPLVARCAIEPDFFVRDMLTWALVRQPAETTVPRLLAELGSATAQARGQALHTLSKIGDPIVWPAIPPLLDDADDEVARSAWRAAVALVPPGHEAALAARLAAHLGRGDNETRLSLSRALIVLGDTVPSLLSAATGDADPAVRAHAIATEQLLLDPGSEFATAVEHAQRIALTQSAPAGGPRC
ncbi:HEAT repeat domain-containing protein [Hoyosella sp. G463]|uniref:HEAT repeat domain-containing protein n=1 Tax=Lolliginicoccus lacisalsi TaxID=2742202 RepID=A0A927PMD5_9ACTN|nr:HEAT repeat domain-containing protein [Lolliginicoccus lacisalsi]MBD8506704.1 HEAT repeat domain-containing protein [Lolliginicoccus lacisalsi]